MKPEDLSDREGNYYDFPESKGKKRKRTKNRRRDVVKTAKSGTTYAVLGIENQQDLSYILPVRVMEYDAMEYSRQIREIIGKNQREEEERRWPECLRSEKNAGEFLSGFRKEDRLAPVVTVVFYHGQETYDGCRDLHSMLNLDQDSERYREWISNYSLNLVTLPEIREELDEETIDVMAVMINQENLVDFKREGGGIDMCKALEDIRQEGLEEGIKEGMAQGIGMLIETCQDFGAGKEATVSRVAEKCGLEKKDAEALVEKYWR